MKKFINAEDVAFFRTNGYLKVTGILAADELLQLQQETQQAIDYGAAKIRTDPGYRYGNSTLANRKILTRIEYVTNWSMAGRMLMGHPDLLRLVEQISGQDFFSIGDGMVLKMPGEGAPVTWHRDHGAEWTGTPQNYNVDIYLDDATQDNCVWAIPGSNHWSDAKAAAFQDKECLPALEQDAVPCEMQAGDILLHDARVIHGSARTSNDALRRTLYYWFYSHAALVPFKNTPGYTGKRYKFLQQCIEARKQSRYKQNDIPFDYRATVPDDVPTEDVSFVYTEHGTWNMKN